MVTIGHLYAIKKLAWHTDVMGQYHKNHVSGFLCLRISNLI